MTGFPAELVFFSLYGLYLLGAAFSYRDSGSLKSVTVMACAVAGDFILRLSPLAGFAAAGTDADKQIISLAVTAGAALIGPAYLVALFFRKWGRAGIYHVIIAVLELAWFLDLIVLLGGLYGKLDR